DRRMHASSLSNNRTAAQTYASNRTRDGWTRPLTRADATATTPREREEHRGLFVRENLLVYIPESLHYRLSIEDAIQKRLLVPRCVLHLINEHHREAPVDHIHEMGTDLERAIGIREHVAMPKDAVLGQHCLKRHQRLVRLGVHAG